MKDILDRVERVRKGFMRVMPGMNSKFIMPKEGMEACNFDLTMSETRILMIFGDKSMYKMSELAAGAGMPLPTVTHVADRLVKEGILKRSLDEKDRRVVNIELTEKGLKIIKDRESHHREIMKGFFQALETQDQERMLKAMENFLSVMEDISKKINEREKRKEGGK